MMDLALLNKLNVADTVTLILRSGSGDILDYYIISQTVSYSVVCSGKCSGTISSSMLSFNIRLSSIAPLIEKGYKFQIQYLNEDLFFVTEDESVRIRPLFVEYRDPNAIDVVKKLLAFQEQMRNRSRSSEQVEELQQKLKRAQTPTDELLAMSWETGPSSNPFDMPGTSEEEVKELEERLKRAKLGVDEVEELNFLPFIGLAATAAKFHSVVDFCGDYATVSLKTSFLFQRRECPIFSIQGQLLQTLIRNGAGKGFFKTENELVYTTGTKEHTTVFIEKYLPNNEVDSSIITRGAVQEQYSIKLRKVLELAAIVRSKFTDFSMDMGNAQFILTNTSREQLIAKFEVEDATTIQLNKMMRGVPVQGGLQMAVIDIPKDVQSVLNLFKDKLIVYVKANKIIFRNEDLYLVFGR